MGIRIALHIVSDDKAAAKQLRNKSFVVIMIKGLWIGRKTFTRGQAMAAAVDRRHKEPEGPRRHVWSCRILAVCPDFIKHQHSDGPSLQVRIRVSGVQISGRVQTDSGRRMLNVVLCLWIFSVPV
jgi:hypothetical protein